MNEVVKKARELMEEDYDKYLPELEVGEICEMNDLWDGKGDAPNGSYSYRIADYDWINYEFKVVEDSENLLDIKIKITDIQLI